MLLTPLEGRGRARAPPPRKGEVGPLPLRVFKMKANKISSFTLSSLLPSHQNRTKDSNQEVRVKKWPVCVAYRRIFGAGTQTAGMRTHKSLKNIGALLKQKKSPVVQQPAAPIFVQT